MLDAVKTIQPVDVPSRELKAGLALLAFARGAEGFEGAWPMSQNKLPRNPVVPFCSPFFAGVSLKINGVWVNRVCPVVPFLGGVSC